MDSNKGGKFDNEDSSSISVKESIVEVGIEGENCLTVINDYEDWEDDGDLQGLISQRNSFNLVSKLWTVYIVVVVLMMCVLIYTFLRDGESSKKYESLTGDPFTFDI